MTSPPLPQPQTPASAWAPPQTRMGVCLGLDALSSRGQASKRDTALDSRQLGNESLPMEGNRGHPRVPPRPPFSPLFSAFIIAAPPASEPCPTNQSLMDVAESLTSPHPPSPPWMASKSNRTSRVKLQHGLHSRASSCPTAKCRDLRTPAARKPTLREKESWLSASNVLWGPARVWAGQGRELGRRWLLVVVLWVAQEPGSLLRASSAVGDP